MYLIETQNENIVVKNYIEKSDAVAEIYEKAKKLNLTVTQSTLPKTAKIEVYVGENAHAYYTWTISESTKASIDILAKDGGRLIAEPYAETKNRLCGIDVYYNNELSQNKNETYGPRMLTDLTDGMFNVYIWKGDAEEANHHVHYNR